MPSADELLSTALAQHRSGNLPRAEQLYRQVLAQAPAAADAWHLFGALYVQDDRPAEGIAAIERAIDLNPANADYYSHLGAAQSKLGQHEAALENLRRAVRLSPQSAILHYNLGTALRNAGQLADAVASFRHAVAADPANSEAHFNLANALRDLGQFAEAETSFRAALEARPNYVKAMVNLGGVLNELERRDEGIAVLMRTVELDPRHARAHLNLGSILRDAGRFAEAVGHLETAVSLAPNLAEAHNNLGTAYQALARFDQASACYERALQLDPQLPDAHFSHATNLLRLGYLTEGFAEYEWRWKCSGFADRKFPQPRWQGEPLTARTILLFAEQGLGDTLQFVRYAAAVQARGGKVVVECQPPVEPILAACRGIDQIVAAGSQLPAFDVWCPLMSLPGVLKLDESQLWQGPYLTPDPERVEKWRARLATIRGFRVGLCWQGNPKHLFDRQRSLPLELLAPLAAIPDVQLISLQKGPGTEQIRACSFPLHELGDTLDADGAFLDTAAAMQHLDLVIAVDTALAHLAGAMDRPVWIPLSANGDWRWTSDRNDSPWYPGTRLFRQHRLDDWNEVVERIAGALRALVAERDGQSRGA